MKFATFLFSLVILLSACDPEIMEEKASLKLTFKARFDTEALQLGKNYALAGTDSIRLVRADLYISDLSLQGNREQKLSEIHWLGFTELNVDPLKIEQGLSYTYTGLEPGVYSTFSWYFGLNPTQNKATPNQFDFTHPLGNVEVYWSGWNSYIFSRTDGKFTTEGGVSDFTYHTGGDELRRSISFDQNIELIAGKEKEIVIYLDYKQAFLSSGQVFDIKSNPASHTNSHIGVANEITDNFINGIRYELK